MVEFEKVGPQNDRKWTVSADRHGAGLDTISFNAGSLVVAMANSLRQLSETSQVLEVCDKSHTISSVIRNRSPGASIPTLHKPLETFVSADQHSHDMNVYEDDVATSLTPGRLRSEAFSHIILNLVGPVPQLDSESIVRPMFGALIEGGIVGIALWGSRIDPFLIFQKACQSVNPSHNMPPFQPPKCWRTEEDLRLGLQKTGFSDISVVTKVISYPWESAQVFANNWCDGENPDIAKYLSSWEGDRVALHDAIKHVVEIEYGDGKDIECTVVLGVGKKL